MTSITLTEAKIERVVRSEEWITTAEFELLDGWLCCTAWIRHTGEIGIQGRRNVMTPGQAQIVSVALRMACDWIAEELENRG